MKIIITEAQYRLILEDKSSKEKMKDLIQEFGLNHIFEKRKITEGKETLEDDFDEMMKPYSNMDSSFREVLDDDYNPTDVENYYLDIDEDWEENRFVFSLGEPNNNNEYDLVYDKFMLEDVIPFFPKKTFDKLLKNWFQKTYGNKIDKVIAY